MPRFEVSSQIAASPERVWELICDTDRYPEWITVTKEVLSHDEGPMGEGYVYAERGGLPPFEGESTWRVTEFTPQTRQVHVGDDGLVTINLEIDLEATADGGTRLSQRLALRPRWFLFIPMWIMWFLVMRRKGTEAIRQTQANAKAILEAPP